MTAVHVGKFTKNKIYRDLTTQKVTFLYTAVYTIVYYDVKNKYLRRGSRV